MSMYIVTKITDDPCTNCKGEGRTTYMTEYTPIGSKLPTAQCAVCKGSGKKTTQITLQQALKEIEENEE